MKVTVAPDSFKESLSAAKAAGAMARGLRAADPSVELALVPMADGGEGTLDALLAASGGAAVRARVSDPLGRPVEARFGLCEGGRRAVVEMAQASGLWRLEPAERDPLRTSTRGTGELIRAALDAGAEEIVVGVGGSATVDCGAGMAVALGARLLDARGRPIEWPCGGNLHEVRAIDPRGLDRRLRQVRVSVACDVRNPLTGPDGAARVYAPQKGADEAGVERLEAALEHFAALMERDLGRAVAALPGAGAAGGLGAGLAAFLGAALRSGVEAVMEATRLEERMTGSRLVLTGEGRVDGQSACGKVAAGVAALARRHGVPAVVLAGSLGPGCEGLYACGVSAMFAVCDGPLSLEASMAGAERLLERASESVLRLFQAAV